jgi:hypothetical protein
MSIREARLASMARNEVINDDLSPFTILADLHRKTSIGVLFFRNEQPLDSLWVF